MYQGKAWAEISALIRLGLKCQGGRVCIIMRRFFIGKPTEWQPWCALRENIIKFSLFLEDISKQLNSKRQQQTKNRQYKLEGEFYSTIPVTSCVCNKGLDFKKVDSQTLWVNKVRAKQFNVDFFMILRVVHWYSLDQVWIRKKRGSKKTMLKRDFLVSILQTLKKYHEYEWL